MGMASGGDAQIADEVICTSGKARPIVQASRAGSPLSAAQ